MTDISSDATIAATVDSLYPIPKAVIKNAYHNSLGSCKFIFKDGKEAPFTGGHYYTSNATEIAELDHEIELGHPHIYKNDAAPTVNVAVTDPLDLVRRAAAEEALRRAAAINKANDMGDTEQGKLEGIGNSNTVAAVSGDSTSTDARAGGTVVSATSTPVAEGSIASKLAALQNKA